MEVTLRSREGKTTMAERTPKGEAADADGFSTKLGVKMEAISQEEKEKLDLENGVKVVQLNKGKLKDAGLEEGFVITRVNKQMVETPADVEHYVANSEGGILIEGVTVNGKKKFFAFE